ncbi:MAG: hypothetical protein ACM3QY_08960 [Candidatus Levyibacteriota bacterium]
MNDEKIQVRVIATGQTLDVVMINKRLDVIAAVLGERTYNVRCDLMQTRNGLRRQGRGPRRGCSSEDAGRPPRFHF